MEGERVGGAGEVCGGGGGGVGWRRGDRVGGCVEIF